LIGINAESAAAMRSKASARRVRGHGGGPSRTETAEIEGPLAMVRSIFFEDMLQALGAMMVSLPLAALGLLIVLTILI
jgi:hypothetical protein